MLNALALARLFLVVAAHGSSPLVDIQSVAPTVQVALAYASSDNIAGRALYPPDARCLLRREVADSVARAAKALARREPRYRLVVKDCYRPLNAQRALYLALQKTHREHYVTSPFGARSAVHTFGAAVDVTLGSQDGELLDMGTPFDDLSAKSQPRHEGYFRRIHALSAEQVARRHLLREVMIAGGFKPIPNEWWHFDRWRGDALRARYDALDVSL